MSWEAVTAISTAILAVGVPATILYSRLDQKEASRDERYLHYVGRYQKIIVHLPYNVFAKNGPNQVTEEQKSWLVSYIDLCTEELDDRKRGAIEEKVLEDWSGSSVEDFKRCRPLRVDCLCLPGSSCFESSVVALAI